MSLPELKIYIVTGEASGDILGAKLISALRKKYKGSIQFYGIAGQRMTQLGVESLFPISELSLMGFTEIIPHIPKLLRRITQTHEHIKELKPDLVVTIDSPGFCFRLAQKLQNLNIPLVHYVAPTVWAYKPERAQKVARLYNHILLLLPFEVPFFDKAGLTNTFIGHPIVEDKILSRENSHFRQKHGIPKDAKLICMLPGSRSTEIIRLLPVFIDAINLLHQKIPDLHTVIPTLPHLYDKICEQAQSLSTPKIILDSVSQKQESYIASDAALVKSGTGALEISATGLPAVIAYKVNPLSFWYIKRHIKVKYVNIINLINNAEIIPELIQKDCTPQKLAAALANILENTPTRKQQITATNQALQLLGKNKLPTPSEKAAEAILNLVGK